MPSLAVEIDGVRWNEQATQHFDVRYRSPFMPKGLVFLIEGIHQQLEFNIGILNPSLLEEKKRFVLYRDREEYLQGTFNPPKWSTAIAYPQLRALIAYELADPEEFRTTLAHEMTHLILGAYFQQGRRAAPRWLDEGLAMLMEEKAARGATRQFYWENARAGLGRDRVVPAASFVLSEAKADTPKDAVRDWYFQAYLMTRALFLEHSKLQFKSFCAALRDGQDLRTAMRKVYGIRDLDRFDQQWMRAAGLPETRPEPKPGAQPAPPVRFHFKPVQFNDFSNGIYGKQ